MGRSSSDRLVTFVDAIVAIAITLLVVPLVERVGEGAAEGLTPAEMLNENRDALIAAAVSFIVIARLWKAHHSIFEHVEGYTPRLSTITIFWAGTIAFLPLPTAMAAEFEPDRVSLAVYIGTMALSSGLLTTTDLYVRRHPEVQVPENPLTDREVRNGVVTTGLFVAVLLGAMLVPALSYFWLFGLVLTGPVDRVLRSRSLNRQRAQLPVDGSR